MTLIEGLGAVPPPVAAPRPKSASPLFAVPSFALREDAADAPEQAAPADGVALGVLALQESPGEPAVRDRAARRHGQAMLASLAALQRAMLDGSDMAGARAGLRALADHVPGAATPELAAALTSIALRARIELARRS